MPITGLNHLAIAVPDIEQALGFWRDVLGLAVGDAAEEEGQGVDVAFLPIGDGAIELIAPRDADSGTARFLAKRGPGIHHLCLEVDDLDAMMARLRAAGVRLTSDEPYTNAAGRRLVFVHPASADGVLLELYEMGAGD